METDSNIRIVIVEGRKLYREGIRRILNDERCLEIVGEANTGFQAIDVISNLKPDVALIDINMPELDGVQLLPIIKQKSPGTKTLLLTSSEDEAKILKALQSGAKGYLSKDTSTSSLIKAIKVVHKDQLWVQRNLVTRFFNGDFNDDLNSNNRQKNTNEALTPREQEVLRHLTKGSTNKEIAKELFISEKTVKSHLNKIFRKLNVSRRLQAILYAIKSGLT